MSNDLSRIWSSKRTIGYNPRLPSSSLFHNGEQRRKERNAQSFATKFLKMSEAKKLQVLGRMTMPRLRAVAERLRPPDALDDGFLLGPMPKETLRVLLEVHMTGGLEEATLVRATPCEPISQIMIG